LYYEINILNHYSYLSCYLSEAKDFDFTEGEIVGSSKDDTDISSLQVAVNILGTSPDAWASWVVKWVRIVTNSDFIVG